MGKQSDRLIPAAQIGFCSLVFHFLPQSIPYIPCHSWICNRSYFGNFILSVTNVHNICFKCVPYWYFRNFYSSLSPTCCLIIHADFDQVTFLLVFHTWYLLAICTLLTNQILCTAFFSLYLYTHKKRFLRQLEFHKINLTSVKFYMQNSYIKLFETVNYLECRLYYFKVEYMNDTTNNRKGI